MSEVIWISIGGFFGAISRFAVSKYAQKHVKTSFPFGTFTVNMVGAFLLGLLVGIEITKQYYSMLAIGFMGAFTTFSTFKLESEQLKRKNMTKIYFIYVASSYCLGVFLAFCGIMAGRLI
jgi:fluoride exporter